MNEHNTYNTHYTMNNAHMIGISNNFYEPTYTIFDNAIVLGHKKTGTRFFAHMASYPINHWEVNHQYDVCMLRIDNSEGDKDKRCYIDTMCGRYITSILFGEGHDTTCSDYDTFFLKNGVSDMNEFMFNNHKNMYIVIRNPVDRFLSGIVQVFGAYVDEVMCLTEERTRIKRHIDINDSEIDNVKLYLNDVFNLHHPDTNSKLDKVAVSKIIGYIIQHYPNLYLQDIHTQNYLSGVKEILYNIKDKSKVKIIDLEDCRKKSAFKLFNTWSDTKDFTPIFNNLKDYALSNKIIYDYIFKYNENQNNILSIRNYLNTEYTHYDSLKNSQFFIKL
jgi:hypothetical protein